MKQLTRSISMFLVCVMSLCLLTACGGGGGPSHGSVDDPDYGYVVSLGCNRNAQKEENLEMVANTMLTDLEIYVVNPEYEDDVDALMQIAIKDAAANLKGKNLNYGLFSMEIRTSKGKMLIYVDSNDSGNVLLTYDNGALSSYISNARYYGAAKDTITDEGETVFVAIAFFAR